MIRFLKPRRKEPEGRKRASSFYFLSLTFGFLRIALSSAFAQPCADAVTITPTTTADAFNSSTTMKNCYTPSAADKVAFTIKPNAANLGAPEAVVVFDVVLNDEDRYPSVVLQVLDVYSLEVNPDIFREPVEMAMVEEGLEGEISFRMRDTAPPGSYTMVISVFRLPEDLRPRDVTYDGNMLAGRVFYDFKIEK
ncbi:MAG: hypothetical protein ACRCYY_06305 [Trueperaceae bacterium]